MNETQALLAQIGKHWGWEVGNKIKQEIATVVGASDIDLVQLQSAIVTIQGLLDANEGTAEFDAGQNIVTQLTNHLTRIVGLESGLATLNADENTIGSVAQTVKAAVAAETVRAVAEAGTYADDTFVSKAQLAAISAETLAGVFRSAMDCAFSGASKADVLNGTGDCATSAGAGAGAGDGAVI